MRRDLERQFGILKALSELDRKILDATGLQPMAEVTVQRMLEIFASRCAAIVIVAQDAGHIAQIIWCAQDLQVGVERIELSSADRLLLKGSGAATQIGADENAPFLDALSGSGAAVYRVLPVILKGELAGALVLGYSKDDLPGHGSEESLQDFGDRLAVAMQAIDRAELLYKRAHYDGLTSLPNRQLFDDRLKLAIAQSRSRGHNSALLFVDLDHFKTVNDSEGHAIGDELLRLAAQRLQDCVAAGDTVARLGGDEFAVILSAISSPHDAAQIADKIIAALSEPFQIAVMEHFISASIGIAMIPADGSTVGELLRSADTALYKAKDLGRKRRVFFEDDMNRNAEERVRLFSDLQHAIERGEFVLHYQAKFDLETRRTVGAEALIRWQHPTRGLVSPAVFIPLAEETGLIVEIGDWVIAEAARQLGAWLGRGIIGKLSLNVSYRQLRDGDVLRSLISASRSHGLPPGSLEVEFTESMLAEDKAAIFRALAELREAGFPIAIDDFGTGYSSFSYLSELPFDVIKLDQAFLEDFPFVQSRTAIVAGILEIARVLGKSIVAEGVETEEQRIALLRHGCTVGQGYLFGRPVCAAEFEASVACETPAIARISGL
jgi:diguanylate cyclase (GGDEF)-like protein